MYNEYNEKAHNRVYAIIIVVGLSIAIIGTMFMPPHPECINYGTDVACTEAFNKNGAI